jgi:bifunctional NMN adenylyltransferase/nudix hydrolase
MTKKYDVIVFIGRFQPFHNAHLEIIKKAAELAEHICIIVGSANQPRTFKNPFSFEEREELIQKTLLTLDVGLSIYPNQDTIYNDDAWAARVQTIVNKIAPDESSKIGIIGHKKDESSFYLDMFPQWHLIEVPLIEELSASQIRQLYFKQDFNSNFIKNVIPEEVLQFLNEFSKTEDYQQILREIDFVEKYKSQYASFPYPPTFVTVDAVVVQSGHILMIRRRAEPGKGLLALPGGFLDALSDKSLEDAMIREVREETQLKVPSPVLRGSVVEMKVFDAIERSTRGRTITHAFHIKLPNGELPKVKGGSDATSAKWIPISEISPCECYEDHYEIINYFTGV